MSSSLSKLFLNSTWTGRLTIRSILVFLSVSQLVLSSPLDSHIKHNHSSTPLLETTPPSNNETTAVLDDSVGNDVVEHGITVVLIIIAAAAVLTMATLLCCIICKCCLHRSRKEYNMVDGSGGSVLPSAPSPQRNPPPGPKSGVKPPSNSDKEGQSSGGENNYEDVTIGEK